MPTHYAQCACACCDPIFSLIKARRKPYCNPCYAVLFGPEGFRQGGVGSTRKSYVGPNAEEEEEEGLELELEGEAFTAESESPIIVEPRLTMAEK